MGKLILNECLNIGVVSLVFPCPLWGLVSIAIIHNIPALLVRFLTNRVLYKPVKKKLFAGLFLFKGIIA